MKIIIFAGVLLAFYVGGIHHASPAPVSRPRLTLEEFYNANARHYRRRIYRHKHYIRRNVASVDEVRPKGLWPRSLGIIAYPSITGTTVLDLVGRHPFRYPDRSCQPLTLTQTYLED